MDKSSVCGSLMMISVVVLVCFMATHGHLASLWSLKGFLMVILGSVAAVQMSMPFDRIKTVPGYIKKFLLHKSPPASETVRLLATMAEKARKEGILSLEADVAKLDDPFLASCTRMAVDGIDPEVIETTLRLEILALQDRHKSGKKFFDILKTYGPGLGLVATLIGQIGMFQNLGGEIEVMGHMLAVAVVATMYGTIMANCIAGPIGDKLAYRSGEEILRREMVMQGMLAIQAGENPRSLVDKMVSFLPPVQRQGLKAA